MRVHTREEAAASSGAWRRPCLTSGGSPVSLIAKKLIGIAAATAVVGALIGLYVSSYLLS